MSHATELQKIDARILQGTCGNCYSETSNRVHVGRIEGFIFCSAECALDAMKRKV